MYSQVSAVLAASGLAGVSPLQHANRAHQPSDPLAPSFLGGVPCRQRLQLFQRWPNIDRILYTIILKATKSNMVTITVMATTTTKSVITTTMTATMTAMPRFQIDFHLFEFSLEGYMQDCL